VTDDPWRKPDPKAPVPPPAYGPPPGYAPPPGYGQPQGYPSPGYAPMPYGPPGAPGAPAYGYNPYQAPLPKRGGFRRLLWILCTVGVLVLGGCGVGIYFLAKSVTKNADAANAFLRDVRDQQFTSAYQRLCPGQAIPEAQFVGDLQSAESRGHAVTSFDITNSNTSVVSGAGTTRTASGNVTFVGGETGPIVFSLGLNDGHLCIESGYATLF
jgi:hypothetical protein